MNGDLDYMGMRVSLNQMDMNVVMYPEITGELTGNKQKVMGNMQMEKQYNSNAISNGLVDFSG